MSNLSCDVLVVGAGLAGFTAATRAAEKGANVLLVEKSAGELGDGNILMASGSLRAGGKSPRTNPRELYDFVMSEGVAYPELVRAWSETCGRAVDWLVSSGVKVDENAPGRVWLDQSGEVSLAPVYKKDVGTRALAKLKERFLHFAGRYENSVEGKTLILENDRVAGMTVGHPHPPEKVRIGVEAWKQGLLASGYDLKTKHCQFHVRTYVNEVRQTPDPSR